MKEKKNVIGHGDIASVLPEQDRLLFFASGVSNSQEERCFEYERERDLLLAQDRTQHLVYFSSLAIFYANTPYTQHKMSQEALIKTWFPHYTIMRIGNIAWGDNPNTIINFFKNQIASGHRPKVQDVYRYVVDKPEFLHWVNMIPDWNVEMNVPGRMMKPREIVREIKEGRL